MNVERPIEDNLSKIETRQWRGSLLALIEANTYLKLRFPMCSGKILNAVLEIQTTHSYKRTLALHVNLRITSTRCCLAHRRQAGYPNVYMSYR